MTALIHTTGVNSVLPALRCACATEAAEAKMARALRLTFQIGLAAGLVMFAAGFVPGLVPAFVLICGFALAFACGAALRVGLGLEDDGSPPALDEPFAGMNPATGSQMTKSGLDLGGNALGVNNAHRE